MPESNRWQTRASNYDMWSRRGYLVATVGIAALSGCGGDTDSTETAEPGADDATETEKPGEGEGEELPAGVSEEEFERGPVPDVYVSATSLGNEQRNPDELNTKSDVSFSEYEKAEENDAHQPGTCCANCADYIVDKNGDTWGACAKVEGYIAVEDWCAIWEHVSEALA